MLADRDYIYFGTSIILKSNALLEYAATNLEIQDSHMYICLSTVNTCSPQMGSWYT